MSETFSSGTINSKQTNKQTKTKKREQAKNYRNMIARYCTQSIPHATSLLKGIMYRYILNIISIPWNSTYITIYTQTIVPMRKVPLLQFSHIFIFLG